MNVFLAVLIIIVCILLVLVVLVQNPKGGGMNSAFGGGNQVMGVRKTADFLEKATWSLAIALIVLVLFSSITGTGDRPTAAESRIKDEVENEPVQQAPQIPVGQPAPAPAPAPGQ